MSADKYKVTFMKDEGEKKNSIFALKTTINKNGEDSSGEIYYFNKNEVKSKKIQRLRYFNEEEKKFHIIVYNGRDLEYYKPGNGKIDDDNLLNKLNEYDKCVIVNITVKKDKNTYIFLKEQTKRDTEGIFEKMKIENEETFKKGNLIDIVRALFNLIEDYHINNDGEKKEEPASREEDHAAAAATATTGEEANAKAAADKAAADKAEEANAKAAADKAAADKEAAKKKADEEAAKKKADEEAAKKKADEEAAKKKADEEAAKKKADEEAAKKKADEEAAKKKADEEAAKKKAKRENTISSISNYFMKDNVDNIEKRFRKFIKEHGTGEGLKFTDNEFEKIDKAVIKRAIKNLSDPPSATSPQQTDSKFSIRTTNALIEVLGRTIKKKKNVKELFDSYNIKITSKELDAIFKNYFENGINKKKISSFMDSESKDNDSENVEFIVNSIAGISENDLIELFKKNKLSLNEDEIKKLHEKYFKDGKFNMEKLIELYGII